MSILNDPKLYEHLGGLPALRIVEDILRKHGVDISRGDVSGVSFINKFGRNEDIDIANNEDVWDGGGTYPFLSAAGILHFVSDNINDTSAGTGARTIKIFGLGFDYNEIDEIISMNGTTVVNTLKSYLRVYRAEVKTVGITEINEGTITAVNGSSIQLKILPEKGQTQMAIYTIPAGKTGYLLFYEASIAPAIRAVGFKDGITQFMVKPFGGAFNIKKISSLSTRGTSSVVSPVVIPDSIEEKSDTKFRAHANANNICIEVDYTILLVDNI